MKNILILMFLVCVIHLGCKKDCCTHSSASSCGNQKLKICDETSPDLKKYVIRNDSSAQFGTASAIKSVPNKGEIEWIANNGFVKTNSNQKNNCFMEFNTYSDTTWRGLEYWHSSRDHIYIESDYYTLGRHEIYDVMSFKLDSTKNNATYTLWADDVPADSWQINPKLENYVIINSIDETQKIIEGEFTLHFIKDGLSPSGTGLDYSNEINFRCGRFKAKIVE